MVGGKGGQDGTCLGDRAGITADGDIRFALEGGGQGTAKCPKGVDQDKPTGGDHTRITDEHGLQSRAVSAVWPECSTHASASNSPGTCGSSPLIKSRTCSISCSSGRSLLKQQTTFLPPRRRVRPRPYSQSTRRPDMRCRPGVAFPEVLLPTRYRRVG